MLLKMCTKEKNTKNTHDTDATVQSILGLLFYLFLYMFWYSVKVPLLLNFSFFSIKEIGVWLCIILFFIGLRTEH